VNLVQPLEREAELRQSLRHIADNTLGREACPVLSPSLFLPYLVLAVVATVVAARRASTPSRKRWTAIGVIALFWGFGYIDDVVGGIQHKWLCHKEAGFWVYNRVKLPPEFYDASGRPKFLSAQGPDEKILDPYLRFDWRIVRGYRQLFLKIDKRTYSVIDKRSGQTVAENITFMSWPSEFIPTLSHISANRCFEDTEEEDMWTQWYSKLFSMS